MTQAVSPHGEAVFSLISNPNRAKLLAMLNNINRLRKAGEIQRVFKAGKSIKSTNFLVRFAPSRQLANRFAIVVGTKVDKRATRRNALKRRMREIIRRDVQNMPQSLDIVLTAHKLPNWPLKLSDIEVELKDLLQKIK